MKSFSIICKSCASRLKVTKVSAIGQTLGCPKCGTMIHVQPPNDWEPPAGFKMPGADSSDLSSFEDIDQLLDQTATQTSGQTTPAANPTNPASVRRASQADSKGSQSTPASRQARAVKQPAMPVPQPTTDATRSPAATAGEQGPTSPVLPGEEWTSASTQKRKKAILMVAGAIGTVVVVGAIITAIVVNSQKPVAQAGDPQQDGVPVVDPETSDVSSGEGNDEGGAGVEENGGGGADVQPTKDPEVANENGMLDDTPTGAGSGGGLVEKGSLTADPNTSNPPVVGGQDPTQPGSKPPGVPLPGSVPNIGAQPPTVGMLDPKPAPVSPGKTSNDDATDSPEDQLGDLASLLEFSNSSLLDLQEVASTFKANATSRLTKYYIEKPNESSSNPERQLGLPVDRIEYTRDVPFSRIVRTASTLAGVPITIDARQLELMGKPVDPQVKPVIEETTIEGMLQQLGKDRDLSVLTTENGYVLTLLNATEMTEATIDFPNVPGIEEEEKQRFIGAIKTMIAPAAWVREEDPATIELVENKIAVKCALETQQSIRLFVDKLDAAAKLLDDPTNESVWAEVRSRWSATEVNREKDPKLKIGRSRPIGDLLNHVKSETGLTVIVDWEQAVGQGWTPMTMLPGLISEKTVGALIEELALGMGLSPIAINSETVMLTTPRAAQVYIDLEVYPVSQELDQQVVGDTLQELVLASLGRQVMENKVLVVYEKRCRCLIVVAPQAIQRQVEKLVKRIDPVF